MPTLEERALESVSEKTTRLKDRQYEFTVGPEMANYVEMLEKYILQMERRLNRLEKLSGNGCLP